MQSEAGVQQWGQVAEGYNSANERVEIPYVRVLKKDGTVVTAGAMRCRISSAPIEREAPVYTDYRQKHITVPGLRPGEVLEYDMATVIHTPLAAGPVLDRVRLRQEQHRSRREARSRYSQGPPVKLKCKPGIDPKITEENGRRIYRWTSSHLEREDDDKDKDKDKKKKKKKVILRTKSRHSADDVRKLGRTRPLVCRPGKRPPQATRRKSAPRPRN